MLRTTTLAGAALLAGLASGAHAIPTGIDGDEISLQITLLGSTLGGSDILRFVDSNGDPQPVTGIVGVGDGIPEIDARFRAANFAGQAGVFIEFLSETEFIVGLDFLDTDGANEGATGINQDTGNPRHFLFDEIFPSSLYDVFSLDFDAPFEIRGARVVESNFAPLSSFGVGISPTSVLATVPSFSICDIVGNSAGADGDCDRSLDFNGNPDDSSDDIILDENTVATFRVVLTTIPLPAAGWMLLGGLGLLAGIGRAARRG